MNDRFAARLSLSTLNGVESDWKGRKDEGLALDGSYLAMRLGNWSGSIGKVDRWWGPGGDGLLASGAISGNIIVWDFSNSAPKKEDIKLAHIGGGVNSLAWVAADELASCGADAMVKTWKV